MRPLLSVVILSLCACGGASSRPTLQGTVKDLSGAALSGVRATVAGSSAVTDKSGAFSLEVESEGPEKLQLNDSSVDIPRLSKHSLVRVAVRMSKDGHAELEHPAEVENEQDGADAGEQEHGDDADAGSGEQEQADAGAAQAESEVELTAAVSAIDGSDLTVGGHLVHTSAATSFDGKGASSLADVKVNMLVEVRGSLAADGSIAASRVHLED